MHITISDFLGFPLPNEWLYSSSLYFVSLPFLNFQYMQAFLNPNYDEQSTMDIESKE